MDHFVSELQRILIGEDTARLLFYVEVIFRTAVMYFYTLFLARMVGQGGIGQLGPFEFVLVIAVGSAAGDPMFYPEIGLLQGIMVITMVILLHRATGFLMARNRVLEGMIEGEPLLVISDGQIITKALGSGTLSERELMSLLRLEGVRNTGEVACAFFEPAGRLAVFRAATDKIREGRSTIPEIEGDGETARAIVPGRH